MVLLRLILLQSLGGAVASLCTLRVLQQAHDAGHSLPPVSCITFGTPAIGNSALAARVRDNGWKEHFHNVALPGRSQCLHQTDTEMPCRKFLGFKPQSSSVTCQQIISSSSPSDAPQLAARMLQHVAFMNM